VKIACFYPRFLWQYFHLLVCIFKHLTKVNLNISIREAHKSWTTFSSRFSKINDDWLQKRTLIKNFCKFTQRAGPAVWCLISISNNCTPFSLFQDILVNAVVENRPWFVDTSCTRVGDQSFRNKVANVSKCLNFDS